MEKTDIKMTTIEKIEKKLEHYRMYLVSSQDCIRRLGDGMSNGMSVQEAVDKAVVQFYYVIHGFEDLEEEITKTLIEEEG